MSPDLTVGLLAGLSTDLLAGLLAGLAVALPIGAIGGYLVGLAARERFAVAAAAALGVATTDGLYALLAGLGIGWVRRAVDAVAAPLTWLAAGLLVLLAVRTMVLALRRAFRVRDGSRPDQTGPDTRAPSGAPLRTYALLVGLTAANPATIATFAAIVVGHRVSGSPVWLALAVFAIGAFAASAAWQLTLVSAGSMLGRVLSGPRGQLVVASSSAAMMLVLAILTVLG